MKKLFFIFFIFIVKIALADMNIQLSGSNGLENRIQLSWELLNYGEVVFEDDFDSYSEGDLNFGDWTLWDIDNAPTVEFIDQNYHFPHPNEPFAWTIANWQNANISPYSAPNTVAAIANLNGVPNNDWLITPFIDLTDINNIADASLEFEINPVGLGLSVDPEHIRVLVSTTGNTPEDFDMITEYYLSDKDEWKHIYISLTDYVGQSIKIAINYCSQGNVCVALDNFSVKTYPDVITAFNVYRTTISHTDYELLYQTLEQNYTDFSVEPNQIYYYVVNATLNQDEESNYSNEVSCYATGVLINNFPYSVDFDDIIPPNLPEGFVIENTNGDDKTWETHNGGANSSPNCIKYTYSSDNAADDWFFTPPIIVLENMDYHLSFSYRGNVSAFTEKLEVRMGQYASSQVMNEQIFNDDNINFNEYTLAEIEIHPQNYQTFVLGWHVYSDADQAALYVDDINLETLTFGKDYIISAENITLSNYPNPFNPQTTIKYTVPYLHSDMHIKIYNLKGQIVKDIPIFDTKGRFVWTGKENSGKNVSSGVYLYKIVDHKRVLKQNKMLLLK